MITNLISPSGEPSIQDNLWHIASSDNSGSTDMKFVFDVYKGEEQLVRVKVFPDPTNGKGYFDASPIVKNEITFGWFVPNATGVILATPSQSGEVALTYSIRVGEDVSAVTTTNLASGNVKAFNFTPTLFKRRQFDYSQFNNKWLTNRPNHAKLGLTERLMMGIKTTSQKQLAIKSYDCAGNLLNNNATVYQNAREWSGIAINSLGHIFAVDGYNNVNGNVWRSTDNGKTFTSLNLTARRYESIAIDVNDTIYVGVLVNNMTGMGDIYKCVNYQYSNFQRIQQDVPYYKALACQSYYIDGDLETFVYASGSNQKIRRSDDNGATFTELGSPTLNYSGIAFDSNGNIYATTDGDIYKSTNNGTTFTDLNCTGTITKIFFAVFIDSNDNIYVTESQPGPTGAVYKSTDGGLTFTNTFQESFLWSGIAGNSNGEIFICALGGYIQKLNTLISNNIQQLDISPSAINNEISNFIDSNTCYYTVEFDSQIFRVDIDCSPIYTPINLHFMNACGVFDTARFKLASKLTMDIERKSFEKPDYRFGSSAVTYYNSNNVYHETKINYGSKAMWSYNLTMDYPTDAEYQWLAELILSPLIYMELDGNYYPVTIKDTNYEYSTYNTNKLRVLNVNIDVNQKRYGYRR